MFFILSKFGISRKPAGVGTISRLVFCKVGYLITHSYNQTWIINKTDYCIFLLCLVLPNFGLSTKPELGKSFPDLDFRKRIKTRDKLNQVQFLGFPKTQEVAGFSSIQGRQKTVIFIRQKKIQEKTKLKPSMVITWSWFSSNPDKNQVKAGLDF